MINKPIVYFYHKQSCHLCDDMLHGLLAFQREWDAVAFEIIKRDIADNEHWYRHYWEYVPTLVIDEQEVCHYFLDVDELKATLSDIR